MNWMICSVHLEQLMLGSVMSVSHGSACFEV